MSDQNFGWTPVDERDLTGVQTHWSLVGEMLPFPKFANADGASLALWDYSRKANGGKDLLILNQATGSCVGNGAWNGVQYLMAMEIVRLGDAEEVKQIFLPYHYGRGRYHAGIAGRGDGSTGSGQAKALVKDGVIAQDAFDDLPKPYMDNGGLTWGEAVELDWSDGRKIPARFIEAGKLHPVKSTALVTTYEAVRDAIANGYPVTVASDRGFKQTNKPEIDDGKLWGTPSGTWYHQMCFIAVDDNGKRPGCYCQNSWAPRGGIGPKGDVQPDGAPQGGFWVDAEVVTYMVKQRDSFALSQFDGFPAKDWGLF